MVMARLSKHVIVISVVCFIVEASYQVDTQEYCTDNVEDESMNCEGEFCTKEFIFADINDIQGDIEDHVRNVMSKLSTSQSVAPTASSTTSVTSTPDKNGGPVGLDPVFKGDNCSDICEKNRNAIRWQKKAAISFASVPSLIRTPDGEDISVICGCNDGFNEGWVIFQRRINDSVSFSRTLKEYEEGFGNASGSFWLGLERLHKLTSSSISFNLTVMARGADVIIEKVKAGVIRIRSEEEGHKITLKYETFDAFIHTTNNQTFKVKTFGRDQECQENDEPIASGWWFAGKGGKGDIWCNPNGPYRNENGVKWGHVGYKVIEMRLIM